MNEQEIGEVDHKENKKHSMASKVKDRREEWTRKMLKNKDFIEAYRETGYMVNK